MSKLDQLQHTNHLLQEPAWMQSINKFSELLAPQSRLGTAAALAGFQRDHDKAIKTSALAAFSESATLRVSQFAAARLTAELSVSEAMKKAAFDTSAFRDIFSHDEAIKAAQFTTAGLSDTMKAAFDIAAFVSVGDVMKSMERLSDSSLLASIGYASDSLRKMTEAFSGSQHLQNLTVTAGLSGQVYQDMIRAYGMDTLGDRLSAFDWPDNITVNDDDSITVNESTIGSAVLRGAITQATESATRQDFQELETQVAELVEQIRKQPNANPVIQQILITVVIGIFFAFFNSAADFITKVYLDDNQPSTTITADQTPPLLSLRLVTRKVLAARTNASSNARTVGQFHANQVVTLIEERDGWALVSWSNKENLCTRQNTYPIDFLLNENCLSRTRPSSIVMN